MARSIVRTGRRRSTSTSSTARSSCGRGGRRSATRPVRRASSPSSNATPDLVLLLPQPLQRLLAQLGERDARGQRLGVGLHVDDRGLAGVEGALERRAELLRLLDRLAVAAEGA